MGHASLQLLKRTGITKELLKALSSHHMVIVSAPMGYGKTTAAREMHKNGKVRTFFFSVPAESQNAAVLWNALWRSMESQGMEGAADLLRIGLPESPALGILALDILAAIPRAIIIIDDYQNCAAPELNMILEMIAWHELKNCRFLLFSRALPEMKLDELTFKGLAHVFGQELLAFSEYEAKQYFLANGMRDEAAAESAWRYSEGWAAALWLCLRSGLHGEALPPDEGIEELLETVVFSRYSERDKRFLMQLSLIDSFTPAETAKLTGERLAGQRLARLRRRNAFISRDDTSSRYQFHSIFKDFLVRKLLAQTFVDVADLRRRTAECYAARREFMGAYRMLVKAGSEQDHLRILELLREQTSEGIHNAPRDELYAIVESIPWKLRLRQPLGYLAFIWFFSIWGSNERTIGMIEEAEKRFRSAKNIPAEIKRRLMGEIAYIRTGFAFNDLHKTVEHLLEAHELLGGSSFLPYERISWTYSSPHLTFMFLRKSGEYEEILVTMEKYWNCLNTMSRGYCSGGQVMGRVEYHLERGELDEAEQLLNELSVLADWQDHTSLYLLTLFSNSRLLLARGKPEEAMASLIGATPLIQQTGCIEHVACHTLACAYLAACCGQSFDSPLITFDKRVFEEPYNAVQTHALLLTVYGKFLLAKNRYDDLAHLIEATPESLGSLEFLFGRIHREIFKAFLALHQKDRESAVLAIKTALDLSRDDGILLPIVEYGDRILPLLRLLRRVTPDDAHLERIYGWCTRMGRLSSERRPYKKSLLTPKERKIMRFVVNGNTTPKIAERMALSESTIKSSLSNIYAKLSVHNRVQASRKYLELYDKNASGMRRHAGSR